MTKSEEIAWLSNSDNYQYMMFYLSISWYTTNTYTTTLFLTSKPWSTFMHDHLTQMPVIETSLGSVKFDMTFRFFNGTNLDIDSLSTNAAQVGMSLVDSRNHPANGDLSIALATLQLRSIKHIGGNEYEVSASSTIYNELNKPIAKSVVRNGVSIISPVSIGNPFNVTPEIVSITSTSATYRYGYYTALAGRPSVRDNGVEKITAGYSQANSEFTLSYRPTGLITCNPKAYISAKLSQALESLGCGGYFVGASQQQLDCEVGYFIPSSSKMTKLEVVSIIARSAHMHITTPMGLSLYLVTLTNDNYSDFTITDDDVIAGSIKHVDTIPPKRNITLTYAQNYTVQDASKIASTVTDANALLFSSKNSSVTRTITLNEQTSEFIADNDLNDGVYFDTVLNLKADADIEADYWAARMNKTRFVYSFEMGIRGYALYCGKRVKLVLSEFNNTVIYADVTRIIRDTSGFTSVIEVLF